MRAKLTQLYPQKSKGGFTLIELLIVMVIIAILAGVIVMAVGGVFGTVKSGAYATAREQIQNAVVAYESANSGSIPTLSYNTSIAGNNSVHVTVINFSAMLTTSNPTAGALRAVPDGTYGATGATDGTDNCAAAVNPGGCKPTSHYIWYVDNSSIVYSLCTASGGTGCTLTNTSGYQGVWP